MAPGKIVMVRHGASQWHDRFCGWVNVPLSERGKSEALSAGESLKDTGITFDAAYTSILDRAGESMRLILEAMSQENLPVTRSWMLNERHYGSLTGLSKAETANQYGEDQVKLWRRSFDLVPPPMDESHAYYSVIVNDPIYERMSRKNIPKTESLKMTIDRILPLWSNDIFPCLTSGKNILIVGHSNSLRGLVKHIDNVPDIEIENLDLPTCIPFLYEFDSEGEPVTSLRFLSDEETVAKAIEEIRSLGKAKNKQL